MAQLQQKPRQTDGQWLCPYCTVDKGVNPTYKNAFLSCPEQIK